eukprot:1153600-Pelagomonas_calceolata.AAC.7
MQSERQQFKKHTKGFVCLVKSSQARHALVPTLPSEQLLVKLAPPETTQLKYWAAGLPFQTSGRTLPRRDGWGISLCASV